MAADIELGACGELEWLRLDLSRFGSKQLATMVEFGGSAARQDQREHIGTRSDPLTLRQLNEGSDIAFNVC